jgi:uncharacterized protein (UPF0261 family)
MDINFQKGKLEIEIVHAILYGCTIITGINIVSRRMLSFAFHATCSKAHKTRERG